MRQITSCAGGGEELELLAKAKLAVGVQEVGHGAAMPPSPDRSSVVSTQADDSMRPQAHNSTTSVLKYKYLLTSADHI